MNRPSSGGEPRGRLQLGAEGFSLFGRLLTLGAELEIHVDMEVSGPTGATETRAWTRAIVEGIEADAVILATSFATFRVDGSLIARWPFGAAPSTRRELAHTLTASLSEVAHHLLELSERFERDPEMRTDPTTALKSYITSLAEESAELRSLSHLLQRIGHDLAEKSRRPIVLVQRPVARRHPMWNAVFAKKASKKGAQRNTTAEPGTSTRPALISLIGDGNPRAPSRKQADESESTRENADPEAPRSTDDRDEHGLLHERPAALPLSIRANAGKRYKE